LQQINIGYAQIFATGHFVSACRRWNEKPAAEKTWTHFKSHFAAAHRQHKQMKGETAALAGFHSANAAMTHNEDYMAEATIGALVNLATANASDRGVVAGLTQANSRLVKQLEESASELRELKTFLNRERRDKRGPISYTSSGKTYDGLMATRWARITQASLATPAILATKRRPLGLKTWEAVRPTRNDVSGRQL
jgi:hypothetical protein